MKDSILSLVRHLFTGLAGLGGFLVSKGMAAPDDAAQLDTAGATLADALAVILAIVLAKLVVMLLGRLGGGGAMTLTGASLAVGTGAGALAICPPSCSQAGWERYRAAAEAVPVQACYYDKQGNRICYSTKDGVTLEVDERSGK